VFIATGGPGGPVKQNQWPDLAAGVKIVVHLPWHILCFRENLNKDVAVSMW
jgi:hypothetical protein